VAVSNLIITVIKNSAKSGDIFGAWIKPNKPNTELAKEDEEPEETSMMQRPRLDYLYFYHPDHLGTSSAITDADGFAYQFFLNLPFGETMAEQRGQQYYNSPYKFNGKELDEETGLYYYGARYYDPKVSIWLSVDPLAEKLPHASPYAFCLNNPILFVDPDGQFPWPWFRLMFVGKASKTSDNNAFKQAATNLNKEYTDSKASIFYISTGKEIVNEINNSSKKIQSIDFFSHSGHNGMFFTHDEWLGDNDFYINDAEENKVAGYWTNDSADLSEIDYTKFTNDAKVEFHGCNSGNKDFADNMASEFSKNMYGAGKTKSVAIGHGTKANPNSETLGNDYRHGLRRVYHNGTELFTTKREGRIPSRIINRFLKQKEKQGESYDGSNQRW
jgi:RHS repeat-associated protein